MAEIRSRCQAQENSRYKQISLTAADGSTSVHKAVPLIYPNNMTYDKTSNRLIHNGDERSSLLICPVGMELLANIHKPIAVLSIAGPARTGKSYILSRLLDSHDAFELGHTQHSQTHGIWIGTQALEYDDHVLVLLDTEGIDAVSADGTNDARILVMTLLMSSYFIYNSLGVPKNADLEKMRVFADLTAKIAKSSLPQSSRLIKRYFPNFLWLLRDFMVELQDPETKKDLTPKEYLLKEVLFDRTHEVRKALQFFPNYECFVLQIPSGNKKVLCNIAARHEELEEEFKSGVVELISLLRSSVTPKKGFRSNKPIDGQTLAELAKKYIEDLNTPGKMPCLDDSWTAVAKLGCITHQKELEEEYKVLMELKIAEAQVLIKHKIATEVSQDQLPLEFKEQLEDASSSATLRPTSIMGIHRSVHEELEKKLLEKVSMLISVTNEAKEQDELKGKFKNAINEKLEEFRRTNEVRSKEFCEKTWQELCQPIKDKIASGDRSYTSQEYLKDLNRVEKTYDSIARGPAKNEIKKEFMQGKHLICELLKERQGNNNGTATTIKLVILGFTIALLLLIAFAR